MDAQINGLHRKFFICKESENRIFAFRAVKKAMGGIFTTSSFLYRIKKY